MACFCRVLISTPDEKHHAGYWNIVCQNVVYLFCIFQTYKILQTPLSVRQFKGGLISSSDPTERKTTDVPDIKARVGGYRLEFGKK